MFKFATVSRFGWYGSLCVYGIFTSFGVAVSQDAVELRHRWEIDPETEAVWQYQPIRLPRAVALGRLHSPTLQHRLSEAQRIVLLSNEAGVTNRADALAAVLEALRGGESNRQVKLALAAAAASLVSQPEASRTEEGRDEEVRRIWEIVGSDAVVRAALEPKLIEWKSSAALSLWRKRLVDDKASASSILTAIEGLQVAGSSSDRDLLENILRRDDSLLPIRISASEALGQLVPDGLESLANEVLDSNLEYKELVAAKLLAQHSSTEAESILADIVHSESTAAQRVAYQAISRNFSTSARSLADAMIEHSDSNIRMLAISVLNDWRDESSLNLQASALGDRNVHVRRAVRENLRNKSADPKLRPIVDEIVTSNLGSDRYEAIEQAILLAVALAEHERAPAFVALLEHPREEVNVRAAWGLQALELGPETLAGILRHCQIATDRLVQRERVVFAETVRIAFLFEALGRHAYRPANEMLMLFVPKADQVMRPLTRASAIYALGHIWQGRENPALTNELARRMLDNNPDAPEDDLVKYTSTIALGRIGDSASVPELRKVAEVPPAVLGCAADWALRQFQ